MAMRVMKALPIKPKRDARHRQACLSLYRALLRQSLRVPLPDNILTGLLPNPRHPLHILARNAFIRHQRLTSARLVVSALKNGYRFLDLLSSASHPESPAHSRILAFLRDNQARVLALRAARPPPKIPRKAGIPLLTKVSDSPPVYKRTLPAKGREEIQGGVRKVPILDDASGWIPFLRLRKPQPKGLHSALTRRNTERAADLGLMRGLKEEGVVEAGWEDEWEGRVEGLLLGKDVEERIGKGRRKGGEPTYEEAVKGVVQVLNKGLYDQYVDAVARGKAMWEIVEEERRLAKKEERERKIERKKEGVELAEEGKEKWERHLEEKRRFWPPVNEKWKEWKAGKETANEGQTGEKVQK